MEDGTKTAQSQTIKNIFMASHQTSPTQASVSSDPHSIYETRLENGDEGILIDTGASINCVGGQFCERYNDLMQARGAPPTERVSFDVLPNPHYISGLGRGTTKTDIAACIPMSCTRSRTREYILQSNISARSGFTSYTWHVQPVLPQLHYRLQKRTRIHVCFPCWH